MTTNATPATVAAGAASQPIFIRGFEIPTDGVYAMDGVTRSITKKAVGTTIRTQVTYDVVAGAVPIELYNSEVSTTAAGPGEIAGEQQFTVLMQYRDGAYVRATAYGRKAVLFREKVMDAVTQKRQFAALAAKVAANEADQSELDKFPPRILSFGFTGTDRPNFGNRQGQQGQPQQQRQQFRPENRTVRTIMSMKLEELFLNYSDGSEVAVITVGSSASAATEEQYL